MEKSRNRGPKEEALGAILLAQKTLGNTELDETLWESMIHLAWENRNNEDRRAIRREIRTIIENEIHLRGGSDAN